MPRAYEAHRLSRNTRFVGRKAELDTLKDLLFSQRSPSVALVGLGGVGKTQVALELAYWARENHPEHSILWAPALSEATFEQAYTEIATELAIRKAADNEDVKESVRRHLSSAAAGPWLLVVDNADDSESGLVLYTTRSPDVAPHATNEVELHKISEQEARTIFEKLLKRKDLVGDGAVVEELLGELTYLPLPITQAAAYLDRNRLSVADYLMLLRGAKEDIVSAMSREFHDSTRYPGSQNATAAALLSFISQIEPKAIPRSILPKPESEEKILVHVATRVWIERQGRTRGTEITARQYLPHTLRVLHRSKAYRTEERCDLTSRVGQYLHKDRRFKEAIRYFEEAQITEAIEMLEHIVAVEKRTLAEDDHSRLTSEGLLTYTLHKRSEEDIP
ncbi:P-loop containing nucleoside triphosphate hydrolase protein [Coniochaeta sp. 2T2.1]|nr:P-loop containing nucleoside triphosphate hydrolase protein [Coniochaeta sp. 2T2.1]